MARGLRSGSFQGSIDVDVDGDNILAAALRHGIREAAILHQGVHHQPEDGCEGCQVMQVAAALKTTQAEDDARWPVARSGLERIDA